MRRRKIEIDSHGENVLRIKSRIHLVQVDKASNHQARADQQDKGNGDLGHNERIPRKLPAGRRRHVTTTVPERFNEKSSSRHSRQESEYHPGQDRNAQSKQEDPPINSDTGGPRRKPGGERNEQVHATDREEQPEPAPCQRQHHAFNDHLTHQPASARAHRRSNRHLPVASHRARQHQVSDIRAGNQEDQTGSEQQQDKSRSSLVGQLFVKRCRCYSKPAFRGIGSGVHLSKLGSDRGEVTLDLVE